MPDSDERSDDLRTALGGPAHAMAPRLLGAVLSSGGVALRITEVEAYGGGDDPGSHAHRGRTPRNATMFGPAGRLYCYFTYGMHTCANVVTGEEDEGCGVLLRAGEIVDGLELARSRRPGASDRDLARGPARLTRALGIALDDDGTDLSSGRIRLRLPPTHVDPGEIRTGPRVGLRAAADVPWRFWLAADPTVSAYRPAAPLRSGRAQPG
ncbi:DNA-3-methyladenine glycosylase [Nocardioides sp. TRM66260-LWL]|uniref:DNA-3-methyladenine glycosylase n=1 Tax=Nocardioides sp. TRM66260-LWL TaxID=2874478 RepID=UPI001CC7DBE2|nr:DNA-3-methyladenine glycosylase [Nocardioides sp. TRM66260-LWL]MBZ5736204.1 DNA-3-methyladenine glycosylase [Nocardioides sp. TRM66260-LWL]